MIREDWAETIYKKIVYKIPTNKLRLKQKEYLSEGQFPIVDQGQPLIGGFTNEKSRILDCELPVVVFGDHTKAVKLITFPFVPGADGTKVLTPHKYVLPKYLAFLTKVLVHKIIDKGYARHYQHIEKQIFPIAPLPEQRAIVAKIEQLFSDLDNGITDLKKAQEQLKIYRQAVLKKAFEGELTKEWREKQTNLPTADELLAQIKEERQKYYDKQLADWKIALKEWEKNGEIGKKPSKPKSLKQLSSLTSGEKQKIPIFATWDWVKIDAITGFKTSSIKAGPFGSSLKKSFYKKSGYKIYGQEQVISGNPFFGDYYVDKEKFEELINCSVLANDILISLVGTVGKVLILPANCKIGIINPRLVKVTLNQFYDSKFFKNYFESSFLKSMYKDKNHGTTMDVLNLGIIQELPFPLCSLKEQKQVVLEIESRLSVCDKVEQTITESLEKAVALRQSILKKAFEGRLLSETELAACKKEKDYEPASELLKKIKAEKLKEKMGTTKTLDSASSAE